MPSNSSSTDCRGEILLVDDSPSSLQLLSTLLVESGYRVREATSGELALWTIHSRAPELILLDLRMPGMDGFEVCRRLKADPATRSIPVIFLSAQDDTTDKVQGLKVGAIDFITKSSAHEEILARINTHVTLARVEKALELERALLELRVEERTEQIARGKNLLRSVIDSGPDWIYAIDTQYRLLLINQNLAVALGEQSTQDLIGQHDCQAFHNTFCFEEHNHHECRYHDDEQRVFAGGTVFRAEETLTLPNGRSGVFETYKTPLREPDGKIYGLLCFRRDITQRLKIEHEKRTLEKELWQAKKMEAVGQLAGGIAHDFNNLLSLILGFAQFASTALANGKHQKLDYYLSEITKAGSAGQAVVAQLLAFSRTDEAADEPIDPLPVIAEAAESLRPGLGENIALDIHLAPDSRTPIRVLIKPVQIRQIVTNLVINARDALAPRSTGGHIRVTGRRETVINTNQCASCHQEFSGDFLCIVVSDTGTGIPGALMEKIFDPFFTTKDVGKGSGLGLAMVHGIVHSGNGHIVIVSAPEHGTEVRLFFPLA